MKQKSSGLGLKNQDLKEVNPTDYIGTGMTTMRNMGTFVGSVGRKTLFNINQLVSSAKVYSGLKVEVLQGSL